MLLQRCSLSRERERRFLGLDQSFHFDVSCVYVWVSKMAMSERHVPAIM